MALTQYGREVIYSDEQTITSKNVMTVLDRAFQIHKRNQESIQYLYDYYKGKQPILTKTNAIRPEINHTVVVNHANEIVSFKVGYLIGEPIQYVSHNEKEDANEAILALNNCVFDEGKQTKDKELADWFTICGTGYRMVLPRKDAKEDESPFAIYTLDPRYSFVVYWSGLGNPALMGVKYIVKQDKTMVFSIWTKNKHFEVEVPGTIPDQPLGGKIILEEPHIMGEVPIIEYPANTARLGAFEIVLPLLDSINDVLSNRLDAVENFVQAFMVIKGADIDGEKFTQLKALGGICVPADGDVSYLTQELNQSQVQLLDDAMYQTVLDICGMPNRNGGSSTSDTGAAVIMRDGWSSAEARAKDTEDMFRIAEKQFLKIALEIANVQQRFELKVSSVEIRFTRRNYENILQKAQVLTQLLANDKVHPLLAFTHSGMFTDPALAYSMSKDYYATVEKEQERALEREIRKAELNEKTTVTETETDEEVNDG